MTINFYLKNSKSKESFINVNLRFKKNNLRRSTGIKILSDLWDKNKQRVNQRKTVAFKINKRLDDLESQLRESFINEHSETDHVDLEKIFNEVIVDKKKEDEGFVYLSPSFEKYLMIRSGTGEITLNTVKGYKSTLSVFQRYERKIKKKIKLVDMDLTFYDDFISYIFSQGFKPNYYNNIIKNIKTFAKWLSDREIPINKSYEKIKKKNSDTTEISLTHEDLQKLTNYKTKLTSRRKVRDAFLFLCYTGLRYIDYNNLKAENIKLEDGYIEAVNFKTGSNVVIPINDQLKEIIIKYYPKIPKPNMTKLNTEIKNIAREVGINENVLVISYPGNRRTEEIKEKWELIKTHTGRRTFITNMKYLGVPDDVIRQMTGHTDLRTMSKYFRTDKSQVLKEMRKYLE